MTKTQHTPTDTLTDQLSTLAGHIQTATYGDMDASSTARLGAIRQVAEAADALLTREASHARSMGHTWQQIGDALGITKQGAQYRCRE